MSSINGAPYWPPPSEAKLEEISERLWGLQAEVGTQNGRIDMLQRTMVEAHNAGFRKIDHCHCRVTETDGRQAWLASRLEWLEVQLTAAITEMRGRPSTPAPQPPPPTFLGSLTELVKALGSVLPQLKELMVAVAVLFAAIAAWVFVPEPKASVSTPTSTERPSAP